MLVLTRKRREAIAIGGDDGLQQLLKVTVLEIGHGRVKLGFEAPTGIPVHRWEVWERIQNRGVTGRAPEMPLPR